MTTLESSPAWKRLRMVTAALCATLVFSGSARAQTQNGYVLGDNPQLEMMVHIIGEVQRPGEFRVPDRTNVIELFSKAGGPTQFSDLSHVTITRYPNPQLASGNPAAAAQLRGTQVIDVNLRALLESEHPAALPMLLPGDVVVVPRNSWSAWRNFTAVIRDISVIAGIYLIYINATRD